LETDATALEMRGTDAQGVKIYSRGYQLATQLVFFILHLNLALARMHLKIDELLFESFSLVCA
jgi:hypothetical protein